MGEHSELIHVLTNKHYIMKQSPKFYEVGIDEGHEIGTHTIATFITEAEAKEFMAKYIESDPTAKLFIDTITSDFIETI